MSIKKIIPFLLLSASMNINSTNLIPLTEFINKNDLNDSTTLEYIAKRCSAHNLAMTRWTSEGDGVYEVAMVNYLFWIENAMKFRILKFPNQNLDSAAENIIATVLNISEEIDEVMKNSQDMRGSIWEGNTFTNDMTWCKGFAESINNLN